MTEMTVENVALGKIRLGERHRKDLGDIAGLAASIEHIGLLQPIGVTPDYQLVWGHRRMEAFWYLKRHTIPARIVPMEDIVLGEYAENEVRKNFTISERVAIGAEVERILGERRGSNQYQAKGMERKLQEKFPEAFVQTRDIAAQKSNFGNGKTYQQAKAVVDQGEPELVQAMDNEKVSINAAAKLAKKPAEHQKAVLNKLDQKEAKDVVQAERQIKEEKRQAARDANQAKVEKVIMKKNGVRGTPSSIDPAPTYQAIPQRPALPPCTDISGYPTGSCPSDDATASARPWTRAA